MVTSEDIYSHLYSKKPGEVGLLNCYQGETRIHMEAGDRGRRDQGWSHLIKSPGRS